MSTHSEIVATTVPTPVWIYNVKTGSRSLHSTQTKSVSYTADVLVGADTDSYYQTKRLGGLALPINPYYKYEQYGQSTSSMYSITPDGRYRVESDCVWVFNNYLWPSASDLEVRLAAVDYTPLEQKAASKHTPDFDLVTFAVQFNQTVDLFNKATYTTAARFADPRSWVKVDKGMRRFNARKLKDLPGVAANSWLLARYGWGPAMMDLEAITAIIQDKAGATQTLIKAIATENADETATVKALYEDSAVKLEFIRSDHFTVQTKAVVAALYAFQKGAAKINPLTTAWELIPYSFVIDWFVSVGNAIDAMSVVLRASEIKVSNCAKIICSSSGYIKTTAKNGYQRGDQLTTNSVATLKSRVPGELTLLPSLNPQITPKRTADAAALLYGAVAGFMSKRKR